METSMAMFKRSLNVAVLEMLPYCRLLIVVVWFLKFTPPFRRHFVGTYISLIPYVEIY